MLDPTGHVPDWVEGRDSHYEIKKPADDIREYEDYWFEGYHTTTLEGKHLISSIIKETGTIYNYKKTNKEVWDYNQVYTKIQIIYDDDGNLKKIDTLEADPPTRIYFSQVSAIYSQYYKPASEDATENEAMKETVATVKVWTLNGKYDNEFSKDSPALTIVSDSKDGQAIAMSVVKSEINSITGKNIEVNGVINEKNEAEKQALKEVQNVLGMKQTGKFDAETFYKMEMYLAEKYQKAQNRLNHRWKVLEIGLDSPDSSNDSTDNDKTYEKMLNVINYKQYDTNWESFKMSDGHTLHHYGCTITAAAMAISYLDPSNPVNPGQHLAEMKPFDNPNNPKYKADIPYAWWIGAREHNLSYLRYGHNKEDINSSDEFDNLKDKIFDYVYNKNIPVILKFYRRNSQGHENTHFIVVKGFSGTLPLDSNGNPKKEDIQTSMFYVNDPGTSKNITLDDVYNQSGYSKTHLIRLDIFTQK